MAFRENFGLPHRLIFGVVEPVFANPVWGASWTYGHLEVVKEVSAKDEAPWAIGVGHPCVVLEETTHGGVKLAPMLKVFNATMVLAGFTQVEVAHHQDRKAVGYVVGCLL